MKEAKKAWTRLTDNSILGWRPGFYKPNRNTVIGKDAIHDVTTGEAWKHPQNDRCILIGSNSGKCITSCSSSLPTTDDYWEKTANKFIFELEEIMTTYKIKHVCVDLHRIQEYVKEKFPS